MSIEVKSILTPGSCLVLVLFRVTLARVWLKNENIFWKIPFSWVEVRMQDLHQFSVSDGKQTNCCLK